MVPACRLPSSSLFLSLDLALTFPSERASIKADPRPSVLKSGRRWLHETKAIKVAAQKGGLPVRSCDLSDLTLPGCSAPVIPRPSVRGGFLALMEDGGFISIDETLLFCCDSISGEASPVAGTHVSERSQAFSPERSIMLITPCKQADFVGGLPGFR